MGYIEAIRDGKGFKLGDHKTDSDAGLTKEEGLARTEELGKELNELLELMFFAGTHSLLIVLQGMDTAGKDGMIRGLYNYLNCQSVYVAPFKVPTPEEMAHDFLWRVHAKTPGKGQIAIFNRSHYEDVLVVRVHGFVPEIVWKARYDRINAFEEQVATSNTVILKFFLHISADEQEQRLLDREKEVEKSWKLSFGDWKERERWDDYQDAYEDAVKKCSTEVAPWYVVPADKKWFRNLAVIEAIVRSLRPMKKEWESDLVKIGETAKAELATYRSEPATTKK